MLKKVVIIMGIIAFVIGIIGCAKQSGSVKDEVKFSNFSQQERQQYVSDYFKSKYDLNCVVSEVKQRQINVFQNEEYYFATVKIEECNTVSVWISKSGEIIDSLFVNDMQEEINEYYKTIIEKIYPQCVVRTYTELRNIPQKTWRASDDIVEFLSTEPVYSHIRIFVESTELLLQDDFDRLTHNLDICDASIFVYQSSNVDSVDIDNYDLSSYLYTKEIIKDK